MEKLSEEEKKALFEKLKELLKPKKERKKDIPEDVKKLIEEYNALMVRRREILAELKAKGYLPKGAIRKGYGIYDYRGTALYNAVEEIIRSHGNVDKETLVDELNKKGYKASGGSFGIVIRNLKEDGKIEYKEGRYIWLGGTQG
ncbi:MAG: hypothetical protein QXI58_05370 [Candidatus Micrarchaeia archaeon]